jgi:hypothetical protein
MEAADLVPLPGRIQSGRACLLRWLCRIVISFALLKSQIGVFAEDPGI